LGWFFVARIFCLSGWAALCGIALLALMRLLHFVRNDAMCCIGRGAKIVTQKTTEVGERGGLLNTEVARNGLKRLSFN